MTEALPEIRRHVPLEPIHIAMGADMNPFGGAYMPTQYDGIIIEHHHVRGVDLRDIKSKKAGAFDVSHMGRYRIRGSKARDLADYISTNNARVLEDNQAQYSVICNEKGGVVDDILVYRQAEDEVLLVVNAGNREKDWAHIQKYRRDFDVEITDESDQTVLLAVQGLRSTEVLKDLKTDIPLDEMQSFHFASWKAILGKNVAPIGLGARDTLRLEAGMRLYGHELTEDINPFEAGLKGVVYMDGGDFVGKAALERLQHDVRRRLIGMKYLQNGGFPRQGFDIFHHDEIVGQVASGSYIPTLGLPAATGYVPTEVAESAKEVEIQVRDKKFPAEVVIPARFLQRRPSAA